MILVNLFLLASILHLSGGAKSKIEEISEQKEYKKLLKTKNNVLLCFHDLPRSGAGSKIFGLLNEVSEKVKGFGTVASVDCNDKEGKKLCKKLKITIPNNQNYALKHYKEGAFHKDYDRRHTVSSCVNFMKDPTGGNVLKGTIGKSGIRFLGRHLLEIWILFLTALNVLKHKKNLYQLGLEYWTFKIQKFWKSD